MPEGILIDYNDGRPVMAITAGLRAPVSVPLSPDPPRNP